MKNGSLPLSLPTDHPHHPQVEAVVTTTNVFTEFIVCESEDNIHNSQSQVPSNAGLW